jgi:hypothetical protein
MIPGCPIVTKQVSIGNLCTIKTILRGFELASELKVNF